MNWWFSCNTATSPIVLLIFISLVNVFRKISPKQSPEQMGNKFLVQSKQVSFWFTYGIRKLRAIKSQILKTGTVCVCVSVSVKSGARCLPLHCCPRCSPSGCEEQAWARGGQREGSGVAVSSYRRAKEIRHEEAARLGGYYILSCSL